MPSVTNRSWAGVDEDRSGGGVPTRWGQADAADHRAWRGPAVTSEEFVPEGAGGHALWAHRPRSGRA
ncbi:hypothetical protein PWG71_11850 [Nocardiopsis sp. N85]|uniref:hypothetical protein n=1 Tax=Nocardiopsis sp. N85 TaxID=3029400 RepID=UPI00237F405A|nr:hypothetical protein [Nocardiopsis sp. N85]MDE3722084.1 hypothetical protein [Nocardiopsis sp. N85]